MGIKIKDAQLTEQLKLEDKFPISNGSDKVVTANIQQVKQLITEGLITQETDPIFLASAASGITSDNISDWNNKVDKISGKQLSTEDFTTALKNKLESLSNYDDTQLENAINTLRNDFDELVSGDTTTAINTFNEIIAFLNGIEDSEDLDSILASIEQQIARKQDVISDLDTIRANAAKGATAIQKVKTINGQSIEGEGNITVEADTKELYEIIESNEKITAAALCELDERVKTLPTTEVVDTKVATAVNGLQASQAADKAEINTRIDTLIEDMTSNEKVAAAAFNDLNNRIQDLANSVIGALNTEV